jgi:hypothetical protein
VQWDANFQLQKFMFLQAPFGWAAVNGPDCSNEWSLLDH